MRIKIRNFEADIPNWVVLLSLLAGENMYTNHCKVKLAKAALSNNNSNVPNDEESQQ